MTALIGRGPIDLSAALEVIQALAEEHEAACGRPLRSIVAFGGTAMAAMTIRSRSDDIDLYMNEVDDAVLDKVTSRFRGRFGPAFKIDATPGKHMWGAIVVEDVEGSPTIAKVRCGREEIAVRALSAETMYVVKTAADRAKDQPDIAALGRRCTYESVLKRAKELFPLYADRSKFPEHVERLARYMARDYGKPLAAVDRDFGLPDVVTGKVRLMREGMETRFLQTLTELMAKRPELLTYDPKRPTAVTFDAKEAGAADEIRALIRKDSKGVGDLAANMLKKLDPKRHMARLVAVKNAARGLA